MVNSYYHFQSGLGLGLGLALELGFLEVNTKNKRYGLISLCSSTKGKDIIFRSNFISGLEKVHGKFALPPSISYSFRVRVRVRLS